MQKEYFDIIVVGAGHAGCEAALAAARSSPGRRPRGGRRTAPSEWVGQVTRGVLVWRMQAEGVPRRVGDAWERQIMLACRALVKAVPACARPLALGALAPLAASYSELARPPARLPA